MALDPARASLVTQEYRYSINEDATIKALFPSAKEVVFETNLDAAGGAAASSMIFNATKAFARVFEVVIEDVLYPEDFIGGMPRYVANFAKHPAAGTSTVYTVIRAQVDYLNNTTILTVRG